jgi:hypothetical protein
VCWGLDLLQVPEYVPALDEEGICKMAFELIFAFDEVISLGHKENVTLGQVKQYVEMESHEERLHKLVIESKINDTKDLMKRKASEIDKNRVSCSSSCVCKSWAWNSEVQGVRQLLQLNLVKFSLRQFQGFVD